MAVIWAIGFYYKNHGKDQLSEMNHIYSLGMKWTLPKLALTSGCELLWVCNLTDQDYANPQHISLPT